MDVSSPSNFDRILDLYDRDHLRLAGDLKGFSFSDDQTRAAMGELHDRHRYIADPHGAVGYLGIKSFRAANDGSVDGIFLETAHPAKFPEIVEQVTGMCIEVPPQIEEALHKKKCTIGINNSFDELKEHLLSC